jgi:hypothetical protein
MKSKTTQILLAIIAILLFMFIFNLCSFADIVKENLGIEDDDKDDIPDEEEEEFEEEEEEDEPDPRHCSNVRYSRVQDGITTKWTAVGLAHNTFMEKTSQLAGGYHWSAFWDWNGLGRISDNYPTRFLLNSYLQGLSVSEISDEQQWWYNCMIATGYGGVY